MTNLSPAQRATAAKSGGWPSGLIPIAVAISMAENGSGDPDKLGDTSLQNAEWGPSVGLWQIRSKNAERGTGGVRDEIANHDPVVNARHAYAIYKSQGWAAWSVYNSGAYKSHLTDGMHAAQAQSSGSSSAILTGVLGGVGSALGGPMGAAAGDAAGAAAGSTVDAAQAGVELATAGAKWITNRHNIMRVGFGVLGVALVVAAAARLGAPAAGKIASVATPIGKAASAAGALTKGK